MKGIRGIILTIVLFLAVLAAALSGYFLLSDSQSDGDGGVFVILVPDDIVLSEGEEYALNPYLVKDGEIMGDAAFEYECPSEAVSVTEDGVVSIEASGESDGDTGSYFYVYITETGTGTQAIVAVRLTEAA